MNHTYPRFNKYSWELLSLLRANNIPIYNLQLVTTGWLISHVERVSIAIKKNSHRYLLIMLVMQLTMTTQFE